MSYPYHDFDINLHPSCSIEDAVAILLGWLRSGVCYSSEKEYGYGVPFEEVPYLGSLVYSLKEHLIDIRTVAMEALDQAYSDNQPKEVIDQLMEELFNRENLITDAKMYISEIHDELLKGESSVLRVDKKASETNEEIFITLASLNRWANDKFRINIFEGVAKPDFSLENTKTPSRAKHQNLDVTFALLIHAFADVNNSGYKNESNKIIVSAIAKELASLAKRMLRDSAGQSEEAIKDRIEKALKEIGRK